jgi:hypothetical protein
MNTEQPYRALPEPPPSEPRKPLLCRLRLHQREMAMITPSGMIIERCKRCGELTIFPLV